MNSLLFPNGGMPVYLDDLAFMQSANLDAFRGIIREVAEQYGGNLILGGCNLTEPTTTTATLSEGWVMIGYEVYYVPGNTVAKTAGQSYTGEILPDVYLDTNGSRTFANGSTQNPWQIRRAKLGPHNTVSDAYINIPTTKRLPQAIAASVKPVFDTLVPTGFINSWNNNPTLDALRVYRQLSLVTMQGQVDNGILTPNSWTTLFVLPTGYRPARTFQAVVSIGDSLDRWDIAHLRIQTTGEVQGQKQNGSFNQNKLLFGVSYLAA